MSIFESVVSAYSWFYRTIPTSFFDSIVSTTEQAKTNKDDELKRKYAGTVTAIKKRIKWLASQGYRSYELSTKYAAPLHILKEELGPGFTYSFRDISESTCMYGNAVFPAYTELSIGWETPTETSK